MVTQKGVKKNTSEKVAKLLLSINAATFRFNPPYTYTSGMKSPIYFNNRLVMSYPQVRKKIIDLYIEMIEEKIGLSNVEWISATATGAIPHGAFVAEKLNLPMVYVRPTTKKYGTGGRVEGYLRKGSKVLIIEDHISTASSVVGNAQAIRKLGGVVKYCVAVTSYETKKSEKILKENRIVLYPLCTGKTIVEIAFKKGILTKEEKESIDKWFCDPLNWVEKF